MLFHLPSSSGTRSSLQFQLSELGGHYSRDWSEYVNVISEPFIVNEDSE